MKKTAIIFLMQLLWVSLHAQQDPMYSQYWVNAAILNPAQVAADGKTTLNLTGRYQWVQLNGAPKTSSLSFATMPVNKLGIGGSYIYDEIGPLRSNTLNADVAYHLKVSKKWTVTLATRVSTTTTVVNLRDLYTDQQNDPAFSQNLSTGLVPNAGYGLLIHNDRFYFGMAQPRVVDYNLSKSAYMNVKIISHRFAYMGYNFTLNDKVDLRPSVLLKEVSYAPMQLDVNLVSEFNKKVSVGACYRSGDGIGGLLGFVLADKLKVYYCYDYPLSAIAQISKQTHQLTLMYHFIKKAKRVDSPRYFE